MVTRIVTRARYAGDMTLLNKVSNLRLRLIEQGHSIESTNTLWDGVERGKTQIGRYSWPVVQE